MNSTLKTCLVTVILFALVGTPAFAQSVQFLPEIDTNLKLNSFVRTYLQAKDDRDEGASDQFSIGPSMQFYFKPLLKLKSITIFDLDDAKPRALVFEMGYRNLTAPNALPINRMEDVLTFHFPLKAGFLIFGQV